MYGTDTFVYILICISRFSGTNCWIQMYARKASIPRQLPQVLYSFDAPRVDYIMIDSLVRRSIIMTGPTLQCFTGEGYTSLCGCSVVMLYNCFPAGIT
jgi:hypothetical protein